MSTTPLIPSPLRRSTEPTRARWLRRLPRVAAHVVGWAFVALAVVGVVRQYTPTPLFDRWAIVHLVAAIEGVDASTAWHLWWAQHNEHRLAVPRLLYWIDCRIFACREVFLLVMNFALLATIWLILYRIGRRLLREARLDSYAPLWGMVVATMCFSWLQRDNMAAGFQAAFFLAYLLPIAAFIALSRSAMSVRARSLAWFAAALLLGVASAGTLANGVAVLPLLAAVAVLLRQRAWRVGVLVAVAIVVAYLYFAEYDVPPNHVAVAATLAHAPVDVARFALAMLGSPLGVIGHSATLASLAGLAVVAATAGAILRWPRERSATDLALIAFMVHAIVSALALAGGRLALGYDYALSSRYGTPALIGWIVALLLLMSALRGRRWLPHALAALGIVVPVGLLGPQLRTLAPWETQVRFERMYAALALEVGARDGELTRILYPTDAVFEEAEKARAHGWAGFGDRPLDGLRESLGRTAAELALHPCDATIAQVVAISEAPYVWRIRGDAFDATTQAAPDRVYFVASDERTVGVGIVSLPRFDWPAWIGRPAQPRPFGAYVFDATPSRDRAFCR